jgi:hypothetical protein
LEAFGTISVGNDLYGFLGQTGGNCNFQNAYTSCNGYTGFFASAFACCIISGGASYYNGIFDFAAERQSLTTLYSVAGSGRASPPFNTIGNFNALVIA